MEWIHRHVANAMMAQAPVKKPIAKKNGCAHTDTHMPNFLSLFVLPETKYIDVKEPINAMPLTT
jgi:hypothetical protein